MIKIDRLQKNNNLRNISLVLLISGILILGGLGGFWFKTEYNQPSRVKERLFWAAIDNALSTKSVVKTIKGSPNSADQAINQQRFIFGPENLIQSKFTRSISNPAESFSLNIQTESLEYPDGQTYTRYTRYDSSKNESIDEYLGVWGQQNVTDILSNQQDGKKDPAKTSAAMQRYRQQYVNRMVTYVIFANLDPATRHNIVQRMKDQQVYRLKAEDSMFVQDDDGEDQLQATFDLKVKEYVQILNQVYEQAGYGSTGLDPEKINIGTISGVLYIRPRDQVVSKIIYGNQTEYFSNHGVVKSPQKPDNALGYKELMLGLQKKLSGNKNN